MLIGNWNRVYFHTWSHEYSRGFSIGVWRLSFMYRQLLKHYPGW